MFGEPAQRYPSHYCNPFANVRQLPTADATIFRSTATIRPAATVRSATTVSSRAANVRPAATLQPVPTIHDDASANRIHPTGYNWFYASAAVSTAARTAIWTASYVPT